MNLFIQNNQLRFAIMAKRFEDRQKSLKMKKVSKNKNLKILILGDSRVGKSALLGQYNWHKFDPKIQVNKRGAQIFRPQQNDFSLQLLMISFVKK